MLEKENCKGQNGHSLKGSIQAAHNGFTRIHALGWLLSFLSPAPLPSSRDNLDWLLFLCSPPQLNRHQLRLEKQNCDPGSIGTTWRLFVFRNCLTSTWHGQAPCQECVKIKTLFLLSYHKSLQKAASMADAEPGRDRLKGKIRKEPQALYEVSSGGSIPTKRTKVGTKETYQSV